MGFNELYLVFFQGFWDKINSGVGKPISGEPCGCRGVFRPPQVVSRRTKGIKSIISSCAFSVGAVEAPMFVPGETRPFRPCRSTRPFRPFLKPTGLKPVLLKPNTLARILFNFIYFVLKTQALGPFLFRAFGLFNQPKNP
ncbi:hypothetical protein DVH24_041214 [Malus domestica]|uniref:Uncharacterized protein n=1 Tax=Malus domestica TaxID=3750 RepID=A0A498IDH6_MALDO|nr:hypothetical protein DVH24_041214 [Malus domestica]